MIGYSLVEESLLYKVLKNVASCVYLSLSAEPAGNISLNEYVLKVGQLRNICSAIAAMYQHCCIFSVYSNLNLE